MFNEQCKVDVKHICEEHINIPILHHPPIYEPLKPVYVTPKPTYAPPEHVHGHPEEVLIHSEPLYLPPAPVYGLPEPSHEPIESLYNTPKLHEYPELPEQVALRSPLEPIFTTEKLHHVQDENNFDKSEKLVLLPSDLNNYYSTHFTNEPRRIKRRDVASATDIEFDLPQLGGVLLFGEELESRQKNLETQEFQLSDIVKVLFHLIVAILICFLPECHEKYHRRRAIIG